MSGSRIIKLVALVLIVLFVFGTYKSYSLYKKVFAPSVLLKDGADYYFYIKTGANYDSVLKDLEQAGVLKNLEYFKWTATKKNYPNHIYPGRYQLKNRMSNNELVNKLRSGSQSPVQITFNNIRTLADFADKISKQIELDSTTIIHYISDTVVQAKYGFDQYSMACMFIPNTYEFYWNVSKEAFLERMKKEYDGFWDKTRMAKANKIGMTPVEVITLASIVNLETRKNDERDRVAGVYINRLKIGMRLQADPTIIFALNDFSIRRVLNKHKRINSPYNTYKFAGLPPGPICFPDAKTIDAVLKYEKHKYYYFCAKPDFSGYHNFARTLAQHNKNARAYQRELNKRRIYR